MYIIYLYLYLFTCTLYDVTALYRPVYPSPRVSIFPIEPLH